MAIQTIDRLAVEQAHFEAAKRLEGNTNFNGVVSTTVSLRSEKEDFEEYNVTSCNGRLRLDHHRGIPTNIIEISTEYYFGKN
ncbi:MAG: hypothetical protein AABX54_03770 [Nanoarchaeota archaeon]